MIYNKHKLFTNFSKCAGQKGGFSPLLRIWFGCNAVLSYEQIITVKLYERTKISRNEPCT